MALPTHDEIEAVFVSSGGMGFNTQTKNVLLREILHRLVDAVAAGGGAGTETPQVGTAGQIAVFGAANAVGGVANLTYANQILNVPGGVTAFAQKLTPVLLASLGSASAAGKGTKAIISDAVTPTFNNLAIGGGSVTAPIFSDGTTWKYG